MRAGRQSAPRWQSGARGAPGENGSGEGTLAWSTAARGRIPSHDDEHDGPFAYGVDVANDAYIDALFAAAIETVEEAILNAMLAAETMSGIDGVVAYALPQDDLLDVLAAHGRGPRGWAR